MAATVVTTTTTVTMVIVATAITAGDRTERLSGPGLLAARSAILEERVL
ncbi:hypothetical protein ACFC0C_24415 [Streptomyces sp. NPDC056178]